MSDPVDLTYMSRIWRVFGVPKLGKVANDSDLLARLRAGICDDACRVRDTASGCACAEAAARIEQLEAALRTIILMDKVHEHDLFSATRVARAALTQQEGEA